MDLRSKSGLLSLALPVLWGLSLRAQPAPATRPKFEVASVKPCKEGASDSKGGAGRNSSPGTFRLNCTAVMDLINHAYVLFAGGHVNPQSLIAVEGGPAWIRSTQYQIDAKADGARGQGMMHGPMLQTLLEDRFHLKIHRETKEVPAYAVTVAKGGVKLTAFQEGSCTPVDLKMFEQFPPPPLPELPPGQQYCGGIDPQDGRRWLATLVTVKGPNVIVEARALSIDDFIRLALAPRLDRPVVNRTAIAGRFDFHLEYAPDETMTDFRDTKPATPAEFAGPSIFTAIERQLGLKLEPARAPRDSLVIDRVEKPSGN